MDHSQTGARIHLEPKQTFACPGLQSNSGPLEARAQTTKPRSLNSIDLVINTYDVLLALSS